MSVSGKNKNKNLHQPYGFQKNVSVEGDGVICVIHAPLKSQTSTIKRTQLAGLPNWPFPLLFFLTTLLYPNKIKEKSTKYFCWGCCFLYIIIIWKLLYVILMISQASDLHKTNLIHYLKGLKIIFVKIKV